MAEGCLPHPVSDCVVVEMIEDIDEGQAAELRNSAVLEMKQLAAAARVRQVLLACLLAYITNHPSCPQSDDVSEVGTVLTTLEDGDDNFGFEAAPEVAKAPEQRTSLSVSLWQSALNR